MEVMIVLKSVDSEGKPLVFGCKVIRLGWFIFRTKYLLYHKDIQRYISRNKFIIIEYEDRLVSINTTDILCVEYPLFDNKNRKIILDGREY
jgi:hypothetical protein